MSSRPGRELSLEGKIVFAHTSGLQTTPALLMHLPGFEPAIHIPATENILQSSI